MVSSLVSSFVVPGLLFPLLAPSPAGGVLHVGPGQPYATIQAAVDAAAPGDVVLVDPGSYPSFAVAAKTLSILAAGTSFSVTPAPGIPEITVRDLAADDVVTIQGAYVAYLDPLAPAVVVSNNAGAVRFEGLTVDQAVDLFAADVPATVVVESTATFWLSESQLSGTDLRLGDTRFPLCVGPRCNDGISGLQLTDSNAVLQNSRMRGYLNSYTALGSGGDGLRAIGECAVWILENRVGPHGVPTFQGGPGIFGGNSIHQVRPVAAAALIRSCSSNGITPIYIQGPGAPVLGGEDGGFYGFNNRNGSMRVGPRISWRIVDHCPGEEAAEVTFKDPVVAVGASSFLHVRTYLARRFVLTITDSTRFQWVDGFDGRLLLGAGSLRLAVSGVSQRSTTLNLPFAVPANTALIGLQLTAQAAVGAVGGGLEAFSAPSFCVLGP